MVPAFRIFFVNSLHLMKKFFHHENTKYKKHENYPLFFRVFVRSYFRDKFICFDVGLSELAYLKKDLD